MSVNADKEISEIKSLLILLDDEDEQIYLTARERLLSHGEKVFPYISNFNSNHSAIAVQRFSEIRELVTRSVFKEQFRQLKTDSTGDVDLEDGVFLIARQHFPDLDVTPYVKQLNNFALELKQKLISVSDPTEILRRTISFFVEEKGFIGNRDDYYSEHNHYINRVLETKIGIPLTLSIIYLLVGKRIDLPISGIGLPGHFTLRFMFGSTNVYFDPFNNGKILSRADCEELVKNLGFSFSDEYLQPVTNRQILERMLRNIILSLEKQQEKERIETIRQFIDSLNSNV
jgi:regulator of sirC expression with transglutaminase-like and TPR domain